MSKTDDIDKVNTAKVAMKFLFAGQVLIAVGGLFISIANMLHLSADGRLPETPMPLVNLEKKKTLNANLIKIKNNFFVLLLVTV